MWLWLKAVWQSGERKDMPEDEAGGTGRLVKKDEKNLQLH